MIESFTLHTSHIDCPDEAVAEIRAQLTRLCLKRNTVGIVACHYDSVEYGVVSALQKALPFKLIGCTTFFKATPEASGLFELTITLLTSDTVCFGTYYSDDSKQHKNPSEKISDTYQKAFEQHQETPALILSFISANRPISGDEYLRLLDEASGNVPSFGFVDSGEDESGANTYIICNDKVFTDGLALLLLIGDVNAQMFKTEPLDEDLFALTATVTRAEGCTVHEINNQNALAYMQKNGIAIEVAQNVILTSLPLYFHESKSDSYVCRLIQSVHEDGSLELLAEVPEGALIRIGTSTSEDILVESSHVVKQALEQSPHAALLLIASCVGRFITLGLDITSELEQVIARIPPDMNYMGCYVGGEICAIEKNGELTNCYHNNSLTLLALC